MKMILNNRSLLKVSGADSKIFLQGQLSNDINALDESTAQLNAYCQHQGKIIALVLVMKKGANFYLSMPNEMLEIVKNRLQMFVIMSEVIIEKSDLLQLGVLGDGEYKINNEQSLNLVNNCDEFEYNNEPWERCCIENNLPEIYQITSEKFVPQMLNLDIDEVGVNFSKGCYPGQEVVARLHYLGKAKRRLNIFSSNDKVIIGDELIVADSISQKSSGIVVRTVKLPNYYLFLATIEVVFIDAKISINNKTIEVYNE